MDQLETLDGSPPAGKARFDCCFVGTSALVVSCAEVVLAAGHHIALIVSDSPEIERWARTRTLAWAPSFDAVAEPPAIDYLFSVVNGTILDGTTLALPGGLAINFHNGPLPRYAGVNAASWAILNGATRHAMTWHAMSELVDGGDILAQASFAIGERATAGDVNAACHGLAVATLHELLRELENGTCRPRPQRLERRTYYAGAAVAPRGGLIDWRAPARASDRLVRAHRVGSVVNTFGVAKMLLPDGYAIVEGLEPLPSRAGAAPGVLIALDRRGACVATATHDVVLGTLSTPNGERVDAARLLGDAGYVRGDRLPLPGRALSRRLRSALSAVAVDERFCIRALLDAEHPRAPRDRATVEVTLGHAPPDAVAAQLLWRLRGDRRASIAVSTPAQRRRVEGVETFVAAALPITLDTAGASSAETLTDAAREQLHVVERRGVYALDAPLRRKALRSDFPVTLVLDSDGAPRLRGDRALVHALAGDLRSLA